MTLDTTMAESMFASDVHSKRRTGKVTLVVLCGGVRDLRFPLNMRESTVGRSSQCTIFVPSDDVSREHAKISRDVDGIAKIIDLDSTNGTLVNQHRVDVEVLREGDRIQVGRHAALDVRYHYTDVTGATRGPCPTELGQEDRLELFALGINLGIRIEHLGEDHPAVAAILHDIARCHHRLGELAVAEEHFDKALAIYNADKDNCPERAHTLIAQGDCRLTQNAVKSAIRPLRTGVEFLETRRASDMELALGRFVLAKTMLALDLSRAQILEYAHASRQGYADGGESTRRDFIEIDRWIRKLEVDSDTQVFDNAVGSRRR